jgi:hypothetical protein
MSKFGLLIAFLLLPIAYAAEMTMCWYKPENCDGSPQYMMVYSSIDAGQCYKYMDLGGDPMKTNGKSFYVETFLQDNKGKAANFFGFDWNCANSAIFGACGNCQVDYSKGSNSCGGTTCNGGNANCACSGTLGQCTNSPLTTFSQAMPKIIVVNGGASACPGNPQKSIGDKRYPSLAVLIAAPFLLLLSAVTL